MLNFIQIGIKLKKHFCVSNQWTEILDRANTEHNLLLVYNTASNVKFPGYFKLENLNTKTYVLLQLYCGMFKEHRWYP